MGRKSVFAILRNTALVVLSVLALDVSTVAQSEGDCEGETGIAMTQCRAENGDVHAQAALGEMYQVGRGVPQDNAKAARWYRKAAKQGEAIAQTKLAIMYYNG